MLVKFLNSGDRVSTAIAGSYFKGDGWTGAYYDSDEGRLVFESEDGLGFTTGDLRVATGGTSSVEWTTVLNKPTSFTPSIHTHLWADIADKPTEFTPVSHNHTISQVTDLQSVIDAKADKSQILTQQQLLATVQAEIAEARAQLSAVSAFASTNVGGVVPGRYYDNATTSAPNSTYTSAVDRVDMTPFITSRPLRVDQIGFAVATAGSAAYGRAFVYGCGNDGWPSDLLFEGDNDLDLNSVNFRGHTLASPITFEANRVYWVGWRFGAATTYAVLRGLNISSAPNLGLAGASNNTYCSVLRRTIPFATRMPATWGFVESDIVANIVPPSIRMRATVA